MNINIVTVNSGWILQKISERICSSNIDPEVFFKVSHSPCSESDVNYYIDLQNCYKGYKTKCDIGFFTHAHENNKEWLRSLLVNTRSLENLDGMTSMNKRHTDMLIELARSIDLGLPENNIITLVPGETRDMFPLKKIKIGIALRGGFEGKGQFFVEKLMNNYDLQNFEFIFLGSGWEERIKPIASEKNISVVFLPDINYAIYPQFYQHIDFLLVPSLWEGGPMCVQEALSSGVPVIASDVGFINYEFVADYVYPPNDCEKLYNILQTIQKPLITRRQQVEDMTWERYTTEFVDFVKRIKQTKER